MSIASIPNPLEDTVNDWHYAHAPKQPTSTENCGKFMIFTEVEKLYATWEKVATLTQEGELGFQSKVCTARPNPSARCENTKVIIVFTYEWSDLDDICKVAWTLFKEGIFTKGDLKYKTDEATRNGVYATTSGGKKVSLYSIKIDTFRTNTQETFTTSFKEDNASKNLF